MSTGLIDIMKKAALEANEASNYTDLKYGTVTNDNPLEVTITTNFILPEELLIVPEQLNNYTVNMIPYDAREDEEERTYIVFNALNIGDRVALIREHGGRKYFILDRF